MPTVAELKKFLDSYKDDEVIAWDIWDCDDVMAVVDYEENEEGNCIFTEEMANKTLDEVQRNKDAEYGISWDTIEYYASEVKRREENAS